MKKLIIAIVGIAAAGGLAIFLYQRHKKNAAATSGQPAVSGTTAAPTPSAPTSAPGPSGTTYIPVTTDNVTTLVSAADFSAILQQSEQQKFCAMPDGGTSVPGTKWYYISQQEPVTYGKGASLQLQSWKTKMGCTS